MTENKYGFSMGILSTRLADLNGVEARALVERQNATERHRKIRRDRCELEDAINLLKRKGAPKAAESVAEPEVEVVPIPPMGRPQKSKVMKPRTRVRVKLDDITHKMRFRAEELEMGE